MLGKPTRVWEAEGSLKQIAATCCWVALGPAEFTELAFLRRVCSNTPTAFRGRRIFGVGLLQQLLNPSTYSAPLSSPQVPRFSCIIHARDSAGDISSDCGPYDLNRLPPAPHTCRSPSVPSGRGMRRGYTKRPPAAESSKPQKGQTSKVPMIMDAVPAHVWNSKDPAAFLPRFREDFVPPSKGGPRDPKVYNSTQLLSWRSSSFRLDDPIEPYVFKPNMMSDLLWYSGMAKACKDVWDELPWAANYPQISR